jgi:hypothetical protein
MLSYRYRCVRAFALAWTLLAIVALAGCATTYRYKYPGHKTFTASNLARLKIGMGAEEVRLLLGDPDEQYVGEFGTDTGEEWNGMVWVYFTELDKSLMYAKRYKKNILVFYPPDGDMKLNHWELEE